MSLPVIPVDSIPDDEGLSLELVLDAKWLGEVFEGTGCAAKGDGKASVRLDADKRDVTLSGTFEVPVTAECVACLEPFDLTLSSDFTLVLEPAGASKARPKTAGGENELTADELDVDEYVDGKIDLPHWLREQVLLEAPVHPRHEGDCPRPLVAPVDVSQEPHQSDRQIEGRAVDPRLAPLLNLVPKTPKKE